MLTRPTPTPITHARTFHGPCCTRRAADRNASSLLAPGARANPLAPERRLTSRPCAVARLRENAQDPTIVLHKRRHASRCLPSFSCPTLYPPFHLSSIRSLLAIVKGLTDDALQLTYLYSPRSARRAGLLPWLPWLWDPLVRRTPVLPPANSRHLSSKPCTATLTADGPVD